MSAILRYPDIPTAKEQGVDLEMGKILLPGFSKDTPDDIVAYYEQALKLL
jgi:tripartite-type tricarboxylate transporter receptor subunit TctC